MKANIKIEKLEKNGINFVRISEVSGRHLMNVPFSWTDGEIIENVCFEINSGNIDFTKEERIEVAMQVISMR